MPDPFSVSPTAIKHTGNDSLIAEAVKLWNAALAHLQQTTSSSPNLIALIKSRAAHELRELCRVCNDEGRTDLPRRKKIFKRRLMAWRSTQIGEDKYPGIGSAWLDWYPALIEQVVIDSRAKIDEPKIFDAYLDTLADLKQSLDQKRFNEAERYRKLVTRSEAPPSPGGQRNRGPSKQAVALLAWEEQQPLHAIVLATFITPARNVRAAKHVKLPRNFSPRELLVSALDSFTASVQKAGSSLTVQEQSVSRGQFSTNRSLAQSARSIRNPKGTKCTSNKTSRQRKAA